jgi:hypothetical protein
MTLILKKMNKHAEETGMVLGGSDDDYVILDQGKPVGRITKTQYLAKRNGDGL